MIENKTNSSNDCLFIKTTGMSMHPFVRDGDKVIVKNSEVQNLKIGDIILYEESAGGKKICHRFVKKSQLNSKFVFFTRGDAGGGLSGPISEDRLAGRVIGIIRNNTIINLRTRPQTVINWLNAKFYLFLKQILIYIFTALQGLKLYRKLMKTIFSKQIKIDHQVMIEDGKMREPGSYFKFTASFKNSEVASAYLWEDENINYKGWWLHGLDVRVLFRGAGIGSKLMQNVIQFTKDKNMPFLCLIVDDKNKRALKFYGKLGFREVFRSTAKIDIDEILAPQITMRLDL